ncbi:MAG: preprotein translocase subunit SecG [Gemmatimonadetes bacterium]|nr:preprotein translocase subunit SecG [Gemmatimonadota bacterium]
MYGFLLALLVLDGVLLTVVILLQAGKGGGLAAMGGGVTAAEGVLGGRQAATFLTRATWTTAAIFMSLSFVLAILSSRQQQPGSVLQGALQAPAAPTPVVPNAQAPTEAPVVPAPPAQP